MKQTGYLFTAGVTLLQMRPEPRGGKTLQTWDTCMTAIVYSGDAGRARETFEDWCHATGGDEDSAQTEIKKIVGAELIDQMLTESGGQQLDWPEVAQRLMGSAPSTETENEAPAEAEDPGYWVDVDQTVPPKSAPLDLESLERGLPEDIGSGLNWSSDKKFLFLLSCLSAQSVVTGLDDQLQETEPEEAAEQDQCEARPILDETVSRLPEMREKESAALVEARNSVVAAWLWRKFAATTHLASNEIVINPCCGIMPAS